MADEKDLTEKGMTRMTNNLTLASANATPLGLTRIHIRPENLDKWMRQNKAEYTGTFVEGCLLDNFMLACKRGFAAVYEYCLNEWQSIYRVEFEAGAAQKVWSRWYQFEDAAKEVE